MTLIGIALCGFLLIALIGTHAGGVTLGVLGVLVLAVGAVMGVTAWTNSVPRPDLSAVASPAPPDPACKALAVQADELAGAHPPLPRDEALLLVEGQHHCPGDLRG